MNLKDIALSSTTYPLASIKNDRVLIKEIQQRLLIFGFQAGPIDGLWGNLTQTAYAGFARMNRLKTDELSPRAAQLLLNMVSGPKYASPSQSLPPNLRAIASDVFTWQLDRIILDVRLTKQIQEGLDAMGHQPGAIDGLWGNKTQIAYETFAKVYQLNPNDLSPQAALFLLEPTVPGIEIVRPVKSLTNSDYQMVAQSIGCEVAAVRAVVDVEAAGSGFLRDGRPKILFEAHWFSEFTGNRYDRRYGDISSPVWNRRLYVGGAGEWDRLYKALCLNREAALKSASWGLGQVMGFNYEAAGFRDVESFVRDMHESEGKQLAAMFNFIKSNRLDQFLINLDWAGFALRYNGDGYRQNRYDQKLAEAYERWSDVA